MRLTAAARRHPMQHYNLKEAAAAEQCYQVSNEAQCRGQKESVSNWLSQTDAKTASRCE